MALFNIPDLKARAQRETPLYKSATAVLRESMALDSANFAEQKQFDIFLSHSFADAELILGVKLSLEDFGYSVYVDWLQDQQLSRDSVTKETADVLRTRMDNCNSLFYATTNNSDKSKWMPWGLGYFDGKKNKAAIFPVSHLKGTSDFYKGQEYLGLYPYIADGDGPNGKKHLWVHENEKTYVAFEQWLCGKKPYFRG